MVKSMEQYLIRAIYTYVMNTKIRTHFDFTYHTQKYDLRVILKYIIQILKTGLPWSSIMEINYKTVHKAFLRLCENNVFKETYIENIKKYIVKTPNKKLKIQSVDSTVIPNKYGSEKVGRNKIYKNKNITKITLIADNKNKPIYANISAGNIYDSKILFDNFDDFLISKTVYDKYNNYFLGDKGYCSNKLRELLKSNKYYPIIAHNKRNTKDPNKLIELTDNEKKIYKKRIKIEHIFGFIKKKFRRIDTRYDRKIATFSSFLFMALLWVLKK